MKHTFTRNLFIGFLTCMFALMAQSGFAQSGTITFTLVKQPCNNDGILVAHTTGLTFPATVTWYYSGKNVVHTINTADDTLFNYNGSYVYVYTSSPGQAYGNYAGSPPFTFTSDTATAICPALASVQTIITGGTSPFTVQWLDVNNVVVATGNPVNLPAGSYNLLITDNAGCVYGNYANSGTVSGGSNYNASVYVANSSPVKDTVSSTPANCTNGTATVSNVHGGIAPYTYLWSNGAQTPTVTGLSGGSYQVTVKDAQGCFVSQYVSIRQSVAITAHTTPSNPTCLQNDGSVAAFGSGGVTPYSYLWSNGQQTANISGLVAGSYYLTVTDANGCTGVGYPYLTATTPITVTYTTTASSCTSPTGSAGLNITGGKPPYTTSWGTYPEQTGIHATNLISGTYNFIVKDSVGCVRTGTVYVPPVSIITGAIYENDATCTQSNGSAYVLVTTGANPYTYAWSTVGTGSFIKNVATGSYSCTITDKLGCSISKTTYVKVASPINLNLVPTSASCLFNKDGSIAATATGGTGPYTYSWTNGQTTATATSLEQGRYWLYVHDTVGCAQSAWTDVGYNAANTSCYCSLTGKVYVDSNSNCLHDAGEAGIPNIMIHADGLGYTFTDANGNYTFLAPAGTYTLSEGVQYYYPLAVCQNNAISVTSNPTSGCTVSNDFANVINPLHDISMHTCSYNSQPVIGYSYTQRIVVSNNGTVTEPGIQMGYQNDGQLQFTGVAPSIFTQQDVADAPNWYSITNSFPSLAPGATQTFDISYNVPANIPLGTQVVFHDTTAYAAPMDNWLMDYSPWNNVNTYQVTTVGSFDPNDKEVLPIGTGDQGFINTTDSILTYTVRFQNCGTYAAQKIVVIDTLDSHLDFTTLKPGYSNHTYTADMTENGIVKFIFNNINLPDSNSQANASIGIITYTVQQKPNLPGGTRITSPASVYFDFNAPVQTNPVLNTINVATPVAEIKPEPFSFNLFPNPTTGNVQMVFQSNETAPCTLRFYSLVGQLVHTENFQMSKGKNMLNTNLHSLLPGLYFAEVSDGQYTYTQKITVIE